MVVEGHPSPEYDGIGEGPVFSPDGKRVAYTAHKGNKQVGVVDDQAGPEYDAIGSGGPSFHADGVLEYLAIKNGTLYRVKHVPAAK